MEVVFENKTAPVWREAAHQIKRAQVSAESVVPDTNDDIGKIASVQTWVLLKSKDVTARGVTVTGETGAVLLYVTESEGAVSSLKLSKSFELEYELADADTEMQAQVSLEVSNAEARILNPRKVSVTLEVTGELSCFRQENMETETDLGESVPGLHLKREKAEAVAVNAVCEKTFAFNEQVVFPAGKPAPSQLLSQTAYFSVGETETVGSRVIVKGTVFLSVCYLSEEAPAPLRAEFSSPFSQIVDIGQEGIDGCTALIELTSCYFDLIETISGEKAMDAELHAVVQLTCRRRESVSYVADAYSNRMPVQCCLQNGQLTTQADTLRAKLSADERVQIAEDCAEVLSVFPSVCQSAAGPDGLSATVALDVIYRNKSGALSSARRLVNLEGECLSAPSRLLSARLSDVYLRPDEGNVDCHLSVDVGYLSTAVRELSRVTAVTLDEEAAEDLSKLPALTLVRVDRESLWELAKRYCSSVESIAHMNDLSGELTGRLLLIPRER